MQKYKVILFEQGNQKPIEAFIYSLSKQTFAKILRLLDCLENYGPQLGMPHTKRITSRIYELRIKTPESVRLLYWPVGDQIFILHGFKKKKQKIPNKEIEIAEKRMMNLF